MLQSAPNSVPVLITALHVSSFLEASVLTARLENRAKDVLRVIERMSERALISLWTIRKTPFGSDWV